MNYEHYKIFYTVGKHKNITRAAAELLSSQPAVTRVIHSIEAELGCQLFIRSKNGVEFTREGEDLFHLLETPFNLLNRVDQDIHKTAGRNMQTIHIGTTTTVLQCFLLDFLDGFRNSHKQIHIKIYTGSSSQMVLKLRSGEIDLVFNTTPFSETQELSVTPVCSFQDILVAGPAFTELNGKRVSLSDLVEYPFILLSHGMEYRKFCDNIFYKYGIHMTPAMEADNSGLIIPMVKHNLGIAFVPEDMAVDSIKRGEMFPVLLKEAISKRHIALVCDPHRPMPNIVSLLYHAAVNRRDEGANPL